jgi:hypothetical protein
VNQHHRQLSTGEDDDDDEPDVDFFQDMVPEVRRTTKVTQFLLVGSKYK